MVGHQCSVVDGARGDATEPPLVTEAHPPLPRTLFPSPQLLPLLPFRTTVCPPQHSALFAAALVGAVANAVVTHALPGAADSAAMFAITVVTALAMGAAAAALSCLPASQWHRLWRAKQQPCLES